METRGFISSTLCCLSLIGAFACVGKGQDIKNFGKCPVEYGYRGSYNFAKESKADTTIEELGDVAPAIRDSILENLRKRVGAAFVKRLKFDYGYVLDFDLAGDLKPRDAKRIDAYDLVFKLSEKRQGLSAFSFKVVTDGSGNLIGDIALPNIASDPKKAQIVVSCNEAREIAAKNGFPLIRTSIYFGYDWDSGSFTWILADNKAVQSDIPFSISSKGTYRKMLIEAHTGKVLKIFKETIII